MMAAAEAFLETRNGGEATGDEDGEEKGPNNVYIHLRARARARVGACPRARACVFVRARVPACVRVSESACV